MGYIITIATSVVSAMLVFILQAVVRENIALKREKEEEQVKKNEALEKGVQCILRKDLIEYHTKYTELGNISSHAYENWCLMYEAYTALKGNGMLVHMNEEIEELHIKHK